MSPGQEPSSLSPSWLVLAVAGPLGRPVEAAAALAATEAAFAAAFAAAVAAAAVP